MIDRQKLADYKVLEARPPRYTSYPTAAHFTRAVGVAERRAWAHALGEEPVSVYVHIPFCKRLCWFCACRTQGVKSEKPVSNYLTVLEKEVVALAKAMGGRRKAAALHLGGGTPTILTPEQIAALNRMLADGFEIGADTRFSVEIDPTDLDPDRVSALAAAGMDRASIGVQDFDPEIQKAIGREQSFEITAAAVGWLRDAGIRSLNADLVYGLPGQTTESLTRTIRRLMWLKPDRIAMFGYAHVPWMSKRQVMIKEERLPGPEARIDLFETARALFVEEGYEPIGIDHFARPDDPLAIAAAEGRMRRNFQGYTEDPADALVGLGASAVSRFSEGFVQNAARTVDYIAQIEATGFAAARGHRFTREDKWRWAAIERLMCDFRLDLNDPRLGEAAGSLAVRRAAQDVVNAYPDVVSCDGETLEILGEAPAFARLVAQMFDAYDPVGKGSSAV